VFRNLNSVTAALASDEGRALKSFITDTDAINLTTDAVLGRGSAAGLNQGLRQIGPFAGYLNTLLSHLIPQTASATRPATGLEPSDFVGDQFNVGNKDPRCPAAYAGCSNGIPIFSAIDLIYEVTNSTSQGYGSFNFGSAGSPNNQSNFWSRQNNAGYDQCVRDSNNLGSRHNCFWGQCTWPSFCSNTNASAAAPAAAPAAQATTPPAAPRPPAALAPVPSSPGHPTAAPKPSWSPAPTPSWSPAPSATPAPTWSPAPAPTWSPAPAPNGSATTSSWDAYGSDGAFTGAGIRIGDFVLDLWDAVLAAEYR